MKEFMTSLLRGVFAASLFYARALLVTAGTLMIAIIALGIHIAASGCSPEAVSLERVIGTLLLSGMLSELIMTGLGRLHKQIVRAYQRGMMRRVYARQKRPVYWARDLVETR